MIAKLKTTLSTAQPNKEATRGWEGGGGYVLPWSLKVMQMISPNPWKKIPQLPESIFPLLPKSPKI